MVEFSNNAASDSEISGSYTDEGYVAAFKPPEESAAEMVQGGVNPENIKKISDVNDKVIATSPLLRKRKLLKKLFLQYIKKYISNPKKYIDHPKQIKNLPSWFDDAIVLFTEEELSRDQKRMIREFFTGLIQYRDSRIASGNLGPDTDETNRQLGEKSPYNYSEEDPDSIMLPRQNEMQKLNIMDIAKNVSMQNTKELQQPTMEDYVTSDTSMIPSDAYITPVDSNVVGNVGGVNIRKASNSFSLNDYIIPTGNRNVATQQPLTPQLPQPIQPTFQQPTRSSALASATQTTSFRPTSIPVGRMNVDLVGFIMGGQNKPSLLPVKPQPQNVQPIQNGMPQLRRSKVIKPKLNRKNKIVGMIPRGISLGKISSEISLKNIMGKKLPIVKSKKSKKQSLGALDTVRNMDKVFAQVKQHSKSSYAAGNMKMKLVSDIKNQCDNAFKTNKFKTESINIKKNFMKDMKDSLPNMRMEMESMGDIHEKNIMDNSMRGIPKMIQVDSTSQFNIKRGSMRPKSVGLTEYDFDLGNIYKKKKKSYAPDDEIYYEESV